MGIIGNMHRMQILAKSCRGLAVLFFSAMSAACTAFLTEDPRSGLEEDRAFTDMSDLLNNGVLTLYNHIGGYEDCRGLQGTGRGIYDLNTFTTDEAIMPTRGGDWYDGGFWQGLYLHRWGINSDAVLRTWEYLYQSIILCNRSLGHISDYSSVHPDDDVRPFEAEVRAVRAIFYWYAMDLFGNIPLVTEGTSLDEPLYQPGRKRMTEFIFSELQEAVAWLYDGRSNVPGEYYGRVTAPVACFVLAKIALNSEVYMDDDWTDGIRPSGRDIMFTVDGRRMNAWETAIHYCTEITGAGYRLADEYSSNFSVFNESSPENIFVIPMDRTMYSNQFIYLFRSRHYNHAKAYGLGGENGSSATPEVLEVFGYGTVDEDPRFRECYFAGEVMDLDGKQIYLDDGITPLVYDPWGVDLDLSGRDNEKTAGARMKKYEVDSKGFKDGKLSDNDIVLFRYADVLLMDSEARIRNGQDGSYGFGLVRERCGAPVREATLENILDERMMELAWEGWRRQDLVRFGLYTRGYSFRPQLEGESSGYTTVFPIPARIREMNPELEQNPGY